VCKFYKQVFTPWSFTVNNGLVLKKVAMANAEHGDILMRGIVQQHLTSNLVIAGLRIGSLCKKMLN